MHTRPCAQPSLNCEVQHLTEEVHMSKALQFDENAASQQSSLHTVIILLFVLFKIFHLRIHSCCAQQEWIAVVRKVT